MQYSILIGGGVPYVYHIVSNEKKDLEKMRGSKYVHSDTSKVFDEVVKILKEGKKVLFSGTPCQIAQIKKLATNNKENLYTFEILCHGTPSLNMFQNATKFWNSKLKGTIKSFKFRDKTLGWGHNIEMFYEKKHHSYRKVMAGGVIAYSAFFLESRIIRPNCFKCVYAGEARQGDITVGDYWGIQEFHPEFLKDMDKGISCLLINTEKGLRLLESNQSDIVMIESSVDNIKLFNGSLNKSNVKNPNYIVTMETYLAKGYEGLVKMYKEEMGLKWYTYQAKALISPKVKRKIKQILKSIH